MSNQFSLYTASFVYAGPTTLNLTQLRSQNIQVGANKTVIKGAGSLDPGAIYTGTIDPRISLATRDLTTLLGVVTLSGGLYCSGGATLRFQKRDTGGAFLGSTNHQSISSTLGWLGIDSFGADRDSVDGAEVSLTYVPLYDGTNAILVNNASVNLSGVASPAAVSAYYMGPVYHNSVAMGGLISARVRTGINFVTRRTDGDVAPRDGAIYARGPMIDLTFSKLEVGATASLFGTVLAGALDLYFLRGTPGGRLALTSGDNHLKVSAATGEMGADAFEVTGEDDATLTVSVRVTGTLSFDLTASLPA